MPGSIAVAEVRSPGNGPPGGAPRCRTSRTEFAGRGCDRRKCTLYFRLKSKVNFTFPVRHMARMYDRWYADALRNKLDRPFVHLVFGARQTGKSTLLRAVLPEPS